MSIRSIPTRNGTYVSCARVVSRMAGEIILRALVRKRGITWLEFIATSLRGGKETATRHYIIREALEYNLSVQLISQITEFDRVTIRYANRSNRNLKRDRHAS